jgi:hypothetical protein
MLGNQAFQGLSFDFLRAIQRPTGPQRAEDAGIEQV